MTRRYAGGTNAADDNGVNDRRKVVNRQRNGVNELERLAQEGEELVLVIPAQRQLGPVL